MGNLMASFNTGVSGLQSAQLSLNTTAHNLANASTTGYTRQSAIITDFNYVNTVGSGGKLAQIGLGTDVVGIRQIRNTFLDAQYRLQLGRKSFYETQKQTLDELEDLFGEMARDEDYVDSFMGGITLFHNAINEIHKSPGDIAARDQLIALAGSLLEQAKNIKGQVDGLQLDLNVEISAKVDRVNELTAGITKW
ncbi:MAG: flagellar basal body protein, partial [Lachnoclostridium sp.]|nr:flagellar basal body protein [Lachnoclostridium sp.]